MTDTPHPPLGTLIRDSVYADGEGGTLKFQELREAKRKRKLLISDEEAKRQQNALRHTGLPAEDK